MLPTREDYLRELAYRSPRIQAERHVLESLTPEERAELMRLNPTIELPPANTED